uniref:Uncharacterized conserved protein PhnB, glyoxalase superfamily n=1 Tax=Candidatus Kentrum sp. TC TaxID=2126339 RepID=A0A450YE79_9GAMM|nr:MAG: Uncharacterized conserved protein PhnB, glyoxalase superfamily [Candidatus Kentron sp. TC]VFK42781.1 MAG: Uncharacterized conserved protein PhnB, glyoxalase superfamily [Candidatus Kentron sp. TC]VFK57179.1 MAG: Uncharacterized conserved protein PhnB, glyoxalase superfamily [Candidatus Kentron sp. TC]
MKLQKITPNFSVQDVKESVRFYRDVLGFEFEMAVRDGTNIMENRISDKHDYAYAMMRKDEIYVMFLKSDSFERDIPALEGVPQGASVLFYIDVENIDEVYESLGEQAEIVKELETTWYGMREFHIRDSNGYILGFAEKA